MERADLVCGSDRTSRPRLGGQPCGGAYTGGMSEIRDELHHLIDSLPEDDVVQVLTDVRKRSQAQAVRSEKSFAWVGSFSGPADLSTNPDHLEGFGRD